MNANTKKHLRCLELKIYGEIGDADEEAFGQDVKILRALASHLDDCGIVCKSPSNPFEKMAVEDGIPVSLQKVGK